MASVARAPGADWLAVHRSVWARKSSVRSVYGRWFRLLRESCAPGEPVVELGCGPGFFKEAYPDVLATDVVPNPHADRVIDATRLPFPDAGVASYVMLDVFHHLPDPETFLREVARTLRPGGRLVLLEPWTGLAGRLLYRWVHHEACDFDVPVAAPWSGDKDPMAGNVALPALYFGPGGHLERMRIGLGVVRREPFAAAPWVLSGGFQPIGVLPAGLVAFAERVDRILSLAPGVTATRCLIVVERAASGRAA